MSISLQPLSIADLQSIAVGQTPSALATIMVEGALPPQFVARRSLQQMADGKPEQWCSTMFMIRSADKMIVGGCGFKDAPVDGRVEIGYAVAPSCRNQGMATTAVRQLLYLAFLSPDVSEVSAKINVDNVASLRVVGRLGFENTGVEIDEDDERVVHWIARRHRDNK